jgi:hypothetical protein
MLVRRSTRTALATLLVLGCSDLAALDPHHPTQGDQLMCGVIYGYELGSEQKVVRFHIRSPIYCAKRGDQEVREIGQLPDHRWQQVACAYLLTTDFVGNYRADVDGISYGTFFYSPSRPSVMFPTIDAGNSDDNPVIYVTASVVESVTSRGHPCSADSFEANSLPPPVPY